MKVRDLIRQWENGATSPSTEHEYSVRLPVYDAARIAALAEMYPGKSPEQLITELLSAALTDLSAAFAYNQGDKVVAYDDMGDPIYEDTGVTPRFHRLTKAHAERLRKQTGA